MHKFFAAAAVAVILFLCPGAFAQQPSTTPVQSPGTTVDVVGTLPLPGVDLPREEIPAPVQSATSKEVENSGSLNLPDFLNRRFSSIHVNETQGNPYQPDINYRGYTASPLLGTPQGLSAYMDGMRLNQPFGDVMSWDLIPQIAISSITLMPGSNPLFGLNTLGGALSIQTKDGHNSKGTNFQATYGSHERRSLELESGGSLGSSWNWYVAGNRFGDNGWRDDSHTDVRQAFGKLGWQHSKASVNFTLAWANNSLTGNGLQEQRLMNNDYRSVYTRPDNTHNRATSANIFGQYAITSRMTLSGNMYFRDIRTDSFNGDINEDALDQSIYQPGAAEQAALTKAGYSGFPTSGATAANTPFPFWRCIGNVLLNDEPGEKCNGLQNRTNTLQHNYGLSGQLTMTGMPGGNDNQFTAGAAADFSGVSFNQSTQLGYVNPDKSITGLNSFADGGVTGGSVDGVPFDNRVDLHGDLHTGSVFATDTFAINKIVHVTVSGRYNRTVVHNTDRLQPGGGAGSLDSDISYDRLNPAVGLTLDPLPSLNLYVGYSEGSRAPTSIEIGCADPNSPCKLPNALAGDPPLEQVVTKTWEGGARGTLLKALSWNAGAFRAENRNDILFVASTQTGFGYFRNFGSTQRWGLEFGLSSKFHDAVTLGGSYTFLDATYQSAETVDGTGNSSSDADAPGLEGNIEISSGDRIPLIPQHMLKAFADYQVTRALSFDVDFLAVSTSIARGNENNLHEPNGTTYLGPGHSPGYGVANLGARYRLFKHFEIIGQLDNVFNHRYFTAAQLGPTGFTATGNFIARPFPAVGGEFPVQQATFYAPAAPRSISGSLRFRF